MLKPNLAYLTQSAARPAAYEAVFLVDEGVLLCDPLTGLVAYPSFEQHLRDNLFALAPRGLHLAIGDVDDLKGHVTRRRDSDPTDFGHIAGNRCMRIVGSVTRTWAEDALGEWPFSLCGTFGGDEVVIAAAGRPYERFVTLIENLARALRLAAPRPCSFATATVASNGPTPAHQSDAYRAFVSHVDASLFDQKERRRGRRGGGEVVDAGVVDLAAASLAAEGQEEVA
jgi:GGDEF domain-containing protein